MTNEQKQKIQELEEQAKSIADELARLRAEPSGPKDREMYYFVTSCGAVVSTGWLNHDIDHARLAFDNCFWGEDAMKRAKLHAIKIASLKPVFTPKQGEPVWAWNWAARAPSHYAMNWREHWMVAAYNLGDLCPTEESCRAKWEREKAAFLQVPEGVL